MSLNVFCSCGPSGGPIQINLPDLLCLLDKTWHIGFYSPSAFKILLSREIFGATTAWLFISCDKILAHQQKPLPKPLQFIFKKKKMGLFFSQQQKPRFFCSLASLYRQWESLLDFHSKVIFFSPQKSGFMHQFPHYPLCGVVVSFLVSSPVFYLLLRPCLPATSLKS